MPFTPFHMGPGTLVKAVAGKHFSLMVFGFAQVAMDVEPLIHLLRGRGIVHGISHTYLGAMVIGAIALFAGRPICQWLLNRWNPQPSSGFLHWLRGPPRITWPAAIHGAFLGTFSHVFIDSLIHGDMEALSPLSAANPLLGLVGFGVMHLLCLGTGILGLIGLAIVYNVDSSG